MEILFHAEQLNYRGTTNSILEYAHYNQEILGNESVIIYSQEQPEGLDVGIDYRKLAVEKYNPQM